MIENVVLIMSSSSFAKAFIKSACAAGIIFTASAFPLAFSKTKVVSIELQNQPIFSSEMRDLAAPYLALSGSFSVAIGFGLFGMFGWQAANRKLSKVASESSNVARDLAIHQAELERIKFSEARLQGQNLTAFLQPSSNAPVVNQTNHAPSGLGGANIPHVGQTMPAPIRYQPVSASVYQPTATFVAQGQPAAEEFEPKGDALSSLLVQLNHLSQQVEELQSRQTSGLAA